MTNAQTNAQLKKKDNETEQPDECIQAARTGVDTIIAAIERLLELARWLHQHPTDAALRADPDVVTMKNRAEELSATCGDGFHLVTLALMRAAKEGGLQ